MRITAGKYRSRLITMPEGIRPTQDKTRKAIFDILQDVEGMSFLELFAGSGAAGIEAESRGAVNVALVENNRAAQLAITKNLTSLKTQNCRLYPMETEAAIKLFAKEKRLFDIIFLDPPYHLGLAKKTLQTIASYGILAPNGFIIAEHERKDILPETLGVFSLIKKSTYGHTTLSFYKKAE